MPDTFSPHYSWLRTWRENASPTTIFYGTTSNLIPEIQKVGLVPFSEGENFFIEGVHDVLALAKKVRDRRSTGFAEIVLMEHPERSRPLQLTFNYHLAIRQAKRKARRLGALQWLYELFFEQLEKNAIPKPVEAEFEELTRNYEKLRNMVPDNLCVVIHVNTDLDKFDTLPPIIEDKKELRRAIKGKNPWCKVYGPKEKKWRKQSREEIEACIETIVRGNKDFKGLGCEIATSETIPPCDIVKIEPVQL
ncbi:MAG: hypothetical protein ACE5IC_09150 [Candidatus Brocadiales bacterium]